MPHVYPVSTLIPAQSIERKHPRNVINESDEAYSCSRRRPN